MIAGVLPPKEPDSICPEKPKRPTCVAFADSREPTRAPPKEHRGIPTSEMCFPDFVAIPAERKRLCRSLSPWSFREQLHRKLPRGAQPPSRVPVQSGDVQPELFGNLFPRVSPTRHVLPTSNHN